MRGVTTPADDTAQAFFQAIHRGDGDTAAQLLDEHPDLGWARSPSGLSPVLFAAYYGRQDIAHRLVQRGVPVSVYEAAATGMTNFVTACLDENAALVDEFSPDGFQLVGLAAFFGHEGTVRALLARGANVNTPSGNAMQVRPLHSAAAGSHTGVALALIEAGADVNARQHGGFTALMSAAQNGNEELVAALLAAGADASARTDDGRTALDLAQEAQQAGAARLLEANARP